MTDQEIEEANKLIAEFMGHMLNPYDGGRSYGINPMYVEEEKQWYADEWRRLDFHTSWDLLIPVLEKVRENKDLIYNDFGVDIALSNLRKSTFFYALYRCTQQIMHFKSKNQRNGQTKRPKRGADRHS